MCLDAYTAIDNLLLRENLTLDDAQAALASVDNLPNPRTDSSGRLTVNDLADLQALSEIRNGCVRKLQSRLHLLHREEAISRMEQTVTTSVAAAFAARQADDAAAHDARQREIEANVVRSVGDAIRTSITATIQAAIAELANTPGGTLNMAVSAQLRAVVGAQATATQSQLDTRNALTAISTELNQLTASYQAKVREIEVALKQPMGSSSSASTVANVATVNIHVPTDATPEQIMATALANSMANSVGSALRGALDNVAVADHSSDTVTPYFKAEYPYLDSATYPDPQMWVESLEAIFLTVERVSKPSADGSQKTMTDVAKVAIATCRLNDVALDWWNSFKLETAGIEATKDWGKFTKELLLELQPADVKDRYHAQYSNTKFTGHPGTFATQLLQLARRIGQSVPRLAISPSQLVKRFIDGLKEGHVKYPHAACDKMVTEILRDEEALKVARDNPNYVLTIQVARRAAMRVYAVTQLASIRQKNDMNPFNALNALDEDDYADDNDRYGDNGGPHLAAAYAPSPPIAPPPPRWSRPSRGFAVPSAMHAMGTRGGNHANDDGDDEPGSEWDDALCQMTVHNTHATRPYPSRDPRAKGISCYICGKNHMMRFCPDRDKRQPITFRRNQRRYGAKRPRGVKPELVKRFKDPMSRRTRFFRRDGQVNDPQSLNHFTELDIKEPEELLEALDSLDGDETIWTQIEGDDNSAHCWVMDDECVSLYWTANRE